MVKLLENLSPKGPRGTEDPEARRARWFIDPSDRNELYHPTLLSKIWDLRKLIIWWMVPLMKYYTHTLHTRVKELKIYPHSSAFPLSYFSQPAPDGCIAYCLCFGILDQFVWENLEWNILLFGVAARHCWETDKPSNVTLSSRSAGWRQTRRSLRTQWLTLGGTPLQGMTPSCLAAKKLSLYDVGWSLYCGWLIWINMLHMAGWEMQGFSLCSSICLPRY